MRAAKEAAAKEADERLEGYTGTEHHYNGDVADAIRHCPEPPIVSAVLKEKS